MDDELKDFLAERKEVMLSGDMDRVRDFFQKWNPERPPLPMELVEHVYHKARTAALDLPFAERLKSKQWLTEHGFSSLDGGDLDATH